MMRLYLAQRNLRTVSVRVGIVYLKGGKIGGEHLRMAPKILAVN